MVTPLIFTWLNLRGYFGGYKVLGEPICAWFARWWAMKLCPVAQPPTRVGLDPKDPSTLHALGSLNGTVHTTFRCGRIIHRSLFLASENVSDYSLLLPCGMGREDLDPLLTLLPLCHALGLLIGTGQFVARENV